MAIVFSKNSGLNDDLWKVEAQVLQAVMNDTDTEKNDYDKFVTDVYNEKTSKKYAEKLGSVTSLGNFDIVDEGDKAPMDDIQAGQSKLIVHNTFSKSFACTREMKDDGDVDVMKTMAANMVRSYKRTRAQFASDAFLSTGIIPGQGMHAPETWRIGRPFLWIAHRRLGTEHDPQGQEHALQHFRQREGLEPVFQHSHPLSPIY